MTKEEIAQMREAARDSAQGFAEADKAELATEALNRFVMLEIAYQLAVANEGKPTSDGPLCACGHTFRRHRASGVCEFESCHCSAYRVDV